MEQSENGSQQHHHRPRYYQRGRGRGQRQPAREHGAGGSRSSTDPGSHQAAIVTTQPLDTSRGRSPRNERQARRPARSDHPTDEPAPGPSSTANSTPSRPSRRAKFKATLTDSVQDQTSSSATPQQNSDTPEIPKSKPRRARREPPGDDLTSTLTRALRTPPFPDCPICFNPIRPEQSTWSCSPLTNTETPALGVGERTDQEDHCCWSTFHLKCIRAWAAKSAKELEEAWRARGESRTGEWRCPGCRATRQSVPQTYMCFCLRMSHPAPPRMATPHSCAQPCSRPRPGCTHACPLPCHPGPCPPCAVTVQVVCFCGKEKRSAKCQIGLTALSLSCAQRCRKRPQCGNSEHFCAEICHEGPCPPCPHQEDVRCWCGRQTKRVPCGEFKVEDGTKCVVVNGDGSEETWTGSYNCGHPCERPFACSHHNCSKICHPPSPTPPPCPFDPDRVTACACGRCRVARSSDELAASNTQSASVALLPPRASCTSPLPTCTSPCSKILPCGHLCEVACHWDTCPPCTERVERTCRCGATKRRTPCSDIILTLRPADSTPELGTVTPASEAIRCTKPCQAFRSCGRHQCGRICCPATKFTRPRETPHTDLDVQLQLQLDSALLALHDCDLPCGRVLTCGNHRCPRHDHKGPCGVCPRGVFDELVCLCGRTVLEPPIQCGTKLQCVYPCARPPPACGHPHVPHACHEGVVIAGADTADEGLGLVQGDERESGLCPPCPYLTTKECACGKKQVSNVRCSLERVSCGSVCNKLLSCGFHHCERSCHADACGTCTSICGKSRRSCLPAQHPCKQICHAPAACPETEPCLAPVTFTCPCGNLRSTIPCSGTKLTLACNGECEVKKRNARLAEALGISEERREAKGKVTWTAELAGTARGLGPKFVGMAEKAFADFVTSSRHTQVLPHMPPERRKFIHDLAAVYRMDTVMVDQEPHRSVQLIRRIDTRIPAPLLSQYIGSTMRGDGTGKLVDLKSAGKGDVGKVVSAWGGSLGAGGSRGAGTEGWNRVASSSALEATRSGSTTPARVPSPAAEVGILRDVSPGPSRLSGAGASSLGAGTTDMGVATSGEMKRLWVSPSVQALRARESASTAAEDGGTGSAAGEGHDVPKDWEDDT